ncbi:non-ribosomal peptide synthetase [Chitinophaga filiformis]|uniref:Non-ribosomal peptide synthase domain TIGR01720/amino acid adenylation domain-containing protein n=1 Tax=Chitinophaga filiformis TaxID=104663 RepID=A0A1G8B7G6_CHIFI|nr:non-ribosomal peptide synthetase [Chitinophaga filiformis]SDH29118.1 non-ribosomal peptide synthase domain TIGR01720/amino acid adenylation domain-containing protein [Chitinophaga filiformis]
MERLIADLKKQQVKVMLQDDKLRLVAPKNTVSEVLLAEIKNHRNELIAYLEKYPDAFEEKDGVTITEEQDHYPASDAQRRMWVLNQFGDNNRAYNIPMTYIIRSHVEPVAFEQAFRRVVERHESLRTVFVEWNGELRQRVLGSVTTAFRFDYIDLCQAKDINAAAENILQQEGLTVFPLEQGPLLTSKLVKTGEQQFYFLLNMHHIISDGWSIETLLKELLFYYNNHVNGTQHTLPPLTIQYRDFTIWQQQLLSAGKLSAAGAYWNNRFSGGAPVLDLPADRPRPPIMTASGRQQWFSLDASLSAKLQELTRQERVSWFMFFVASFKALFFKYTGQEDIVIGTPVANRTSEDMNGQIGLYMNTLALRTKISAEAPFSALLHQVKETILDASTYQEYPFDRLVDDLSLKRDLSRSPLFDVMITVPADATSIDAGMSDTDTMDIHAIPGNTDTAQFDLSIDVVRKGAIFDVSIIYNTDIFDDWRITNMFSHYHQLLAAIVSQPASPLYALEHLTAEEKEQLIYGFNGSGQHAPVPDKSYVEYFEEQVKQTPHHIAIQCGTETLTYSQLDALSDQLAQWLLAQGLKKGDFVPLLFERSIDTLVSIIAIFKAGGAFMLLDPAYPLKRMIDLLTDTRAGILITRSANISEWPAFWESVAAATELQTILLLDRATSSSVGNLRLAGTDEYSHHPAIKPAVKLLPDDTSFIIYTSGSTGKPKGALNLHIGMVNHCQIMIRRFEIDENSVVAQTAPVSFDISVWQLITGVLTGAKTVIYPQSLIHNPAALLREMQKDQVTVLQWVPSYLTAILQELAQYPDENFFPALKYLILCGEAIRPLLVKEWFRYYPRVKVANAYGPAEASDDVTMNVVSAATFDDKISIGRPVDNCRIYILDKYHRLCPVGQIGEICVAGIAVGGGYLNEPQKTAAVFHKDPFTSVGQMMYCTGDLGYWLPDGNLEFIGRKDHQVKIRGQRVELGEVEVLLLRHPAIKQVIVLDIIDEQQNTDLVAFIVAAPEAENPDTTTIKSWLEQQVPAFMVPSRFLVLNEMPLTDNGKVDRKQLRQTIHDQQYLAEEQLVAPSNEREKQLLKLWREILRLDRISVTANFFDIGGHSLKAVRLISAIYKEMGCRLDLKDIFINATIQKQAALLKDQHIHAYTSIHPVPVQEYYDVSHAQRRIWLSEQIHTTGAYNIPESFELIGDIDDTLFDKAFRYLIQRHEILRTTFITVDGVPKQVVHPVANFPFRVELTDLRTVADKEAVASKLVDQEAWRPFRLDTAPLMYARLIQMEDQRYIFIFTMHHIISDGWSLDIIIREVLTVYRAYLAGKEPDLAPLRIHYKDYSAWQLAALSGEPYHAHKDYWMSRFADGVPVLELQTDAVRPSRKTYNGATVNSRLSRELKLGLEQLGRKADATMFMLMISAVNALLYKYTGQEDIVTGASVSDRDHPELEDQIGFFVNMLPLRNRFNGDDSFIALLNTVKGTTLDGFAHQVYPFDMIVDDLKLERDLSRNPLFDIAITMQDTDTGEDAVALLEDIRVNDYSKKTKLAKFDLTFFFASHDGGIEMTVLYNTDLFSEHRMRRMTAHFEQLLQAVVKMPDQPLRFVPYLTAQELERIMRFSVPPVPVTNVGLLVHEMIEEQAKLHPDEAAVIYKGTRLSYQSLNEQANQLAHYMRQQLQIKPGDLVGVMMERSEKMIISLLAIMKAGAAWLPIEVSFPDRRKALILEDASPVLLITESNYMFSLDYYSGQLFITDIQWGDLPQEKDNLVLMQTPEDPVYVIYTSGSTGKPKGVTIPYRALAAYVSWFKTIFDTGLGDSTLMLSSIAFDLGYTSLWGALTTGASLVIGKGGDYFDREEFVQLLIDENVTFLKLTPSHLDVLVNDPAFGEEAPRMSLRLIITGGESIRPDDIHTLLQAFPQCKVVNHYGPTETTIGTLAGVYDKERPVLGRPIADNKVFILDSGLQHLPVGITGEICVAGTGLAIGYLHQEALTQQKFVRAPWGEGERLYRTGDLGYYTEGGEVVFVGRRDNQVKIRGYRVETDDIEAVLLRHEAIRNALVIALKQEEQYSLVAYYQESIPLTEDILRDYLKDTLPDYMIPATFIQVEEFPLTANGKIDRRLLPLPGGAKKIVMQAARTLIEEKLVEVWKEVLGHAEVSTLANFFSVGGDSIKAIQVASRMSRAGFRIGVKEIFENPVLIDLARYVKEIARTASQLPVQGVMPLTPIQQRFLASGYLQMQHYNQSVLFKAGHRWSEQGLRDVFAIIQTHHDALRITFRQNVAGHWIAENKGPELLPDITRIDLLTAAEPLQDMALIADQLQASIDLEHGPLMKVVLFQLPDGDRLLIIVHHLVMDGISWRILSEDIQSLYEQYEKGQSLALPLKTDAYKLWAEKLHAYAQTDDCRQELKYWLSLTEQPLPSLPRDHEIVSNTLADRGADTFELDEATTVQLLEKVPNAFGTEVNDILLTALSCALEKTFNIRKCLVALEGHGREEIFGEEVDITRTIGWFTNVYPVLLDISRADTLSRKIIHVKESLHRVPQKGIRYGILKYLGDEATQQALHTQQQPVISFNYLGEFKPGLALAEEDHGRNTDESWNAFYSLDVGGIVINKKLQLSIEYNVKEYDAATIDTLIQAYKTSLLEVISNCLQQQKRILTPCDLTFKDIPEALLEKLTKEMDIEDIYPLSPLQAGMLFLAGVQTEDAYYRQVYYSLKGQLQEKFVEKSLQGLFVRHDILRTAFSENLTDTPLQIVLKNRKPFFKFIDLSDSEPAAQRSYVDAYRASDKSRGFRLDKDVLMRMTVFKLSDSEFDIVWSYHHILMDGWCSAILINEFFEHYNALLQGVTPDLNAVTPYRDYILYLEKQDKAASLAHWRKYLSGYTELATLPAWKQVLTTQYEEGKVSLHIPEQLTKTLHTIAAGKGVTQNVLLQSVWGLLLGLYNNREDVVFGAVVSGRPEVIPGIESMVGLFVNTIPVRVRFEDDQTFSDLLYQMQVQQVANAPYHYCQLADIQRVSDAGTQLLDHIMVFENYPLAEKVDEQVATINERDKGVWQFTIDNLEYEERSHYNFYLIITPGETISVQFGYNQQYYDSALVEQLSRHFSSLLGAIAADPEQPLSRLLGLTLKEQASLYVHLPYNRESTILEEFRQMVTAYPDAVAVISETARLTYNQLNDAASKVAAYLLQHKQVSKGMPVGVMTDRSIYMPIAILGILKAGAVYVPIDPAYPLQRKMSIISDTGMQYLLSDLKEELPACELLSVQELIQSNEPATGIHVQADDLAYIIYTSGSTGVPNGVMIHHRGAVNMVVSQRHYFKISPDDRILQFASLSFDASVWECMMALLSGASLVMADKAVIEDPRRFADYISAQQVTVMTLPPVYLSVLPETALKGIRVLITAGEEARVRDLTAYSATMDCWNAYGPSECSVCVSMYKVSPEDENRPRVPIGAPIGNTRVYIMDQHHRVLPAGVTGEICVEGDGVGTGYWGREELTAKKFITVDGRRLYRTGDVGRWLPDGNLEFLGRVDDQVKIRGHRIETGEILNTIRQYPGVTEAFVTTGTSGEDKYLVGYFVASPVVKDELLFKYLQDALPAYMVPANMIRLDKFPLTPNGKIDKKGLPTVQEKTHADTRTLPVTTEEILLAEIWEKVLGRTSPVSADDNFYQVGGDSIKAMQIAARLHRMGYGTTARDILQYPVLSQLATTLKKDRQQADQSAVSGELPLTHIQHWFFENGGPVHHFNQSVTLRFKEKVAPDILKEVLRRLQVHHDALRMTFTLQNGKWIQQNQGPELALFWQEHDLSGSITPQDDLAMWSAHYQRSLNLETGPLMKPVLFHMSDGDRLLIVMHHLIVDGVSWRILLEDIHTLCLQLKEGEEPVLPPKTHSYLHWATSLLQYADNSALLQEKAYWSHIASQFNGERRKYRLDELHQHRFILDRDTTTALTGAANAAFQTEANDLIMAGFALAMKKVFGTAPLLLSMEGHGREQIVPGIDVGRTVGWFTSLYPLMITIGDDIRNAIIHTKESLRSVPAKGIGYGVLRYLTPGALPGGYPAISYNYLGQFDEVASLELFEITGEEGPNFSNDREWDFHLSISSFIKDGSLSFNLAYHSGLFTHESIRQLEIAIADGLKDIVAYCADREQVATPSDMTLKGLSMNELDLLSKGLH